MTGREAATASRELGAQAGRSSWDEGFRPQGHSPPTPNHSPGAEPSGRDLGREWEETAPGKEGGRFQVVPGPEVSLFFPAGRHR